MVWVCFLEMDRRNPKSKGPRMWGKPQDQRALVGCECAESLDHQSNPTWGQKEISFVKEHEVCIFVITLLSSVPLGQLLILSTLNPPWTAWNSESLGDVSGFNLSWAAATFSNWQHTQIQVGFTNMSTSTTRHTWAVWVRHSRSESAPERLSGIYQSASLLCSVLASFSGRKSHLHEYPRFLCHSTQQCPCEKEIAFPWSSGKKPWDWVSLPWSGSQFIYEWIAPTVTGQV